MHRQSETAPSSLVVTSPAFAMNSEIPVEFSADGYDVAPPLAWSAPPAGTRSIAILVEDPDAPRRVFVHWIAVNIPPTARELPAGGELPERALHGTNDYGERGWNGPNPPHGRHRYFFRVFALDIELDRPGLTKPELMAAIEGHVLARGEVVGTYEKAPEPISFRDE